RNLYRPFYRYLALHWPRHSGVAIGDKLLVEIIGDARPEGARPWSIPDLVAINCLRYQWPPRQELEVHAFEVKTASGGSDIRLSPTVPLPITPIFAGTSETACLPIRLTASSKPAGR